MIETLLSLLGGGALRIVPELIGLWNKKTDNEHELAMLDKQLDLERTKSAGQQSVIESQSYANQMLALIESQKAAMQSQMQKVDIKWVDALNFLVRPLTTYWFLFLYSLVKVMKIVIAFQTTDAWTAIVNCWTPKIWPSCLA